MTDNGTLADIITANGGDVDAMHTLLVDELAKGKKMEKILRIP